MPQLNLKMCGTFMTFLRIQNIAKQADAMGFVSCSTLEWEPLHS